MPISANSIKSKAKKTALNAHVTVQEVLQNYMLERILVKISKSIYCEHFILKGGFLVTSYSGIQSRTTMDMDLMLSDMDLRQTEIYRIVEEILAIDTEDGITFEISAIDEIRNDDEYGGFRFKITGRLENIRNHLSLDISTGDIITPKEVTLNYKMIFEDEYIPIRAYNRETLLAEKFQTILENNGARGRMKDYYDIWLFLHFYWNEIDVILLVTAVEQTFARRGSIKELDRADTIINILRTSKIMNKRWNDYSSKHTYTKGILFDDVIESIYEFSNQIRDARNNM